MYKENKRDKVLVFATLIFMHLILISSIQVSAKSYEFKNEQISEEIVINQMQSPEMQALKDYYNKFVIGDPQQIINKNNGEEILKDAVKGRFKLNIMDILKKIFSYFLKEIYLNMNILLKLIVIIIICAVLSNLQNSFAKEGVGELAFFTCYIILVSILVIGFKEATSFGINVIERMAGFMYASIPVMISLLVSSGSIMSGGIFQPILFMVVQTATLIVKNVFVPLVFFSTALSIINNISDRLHLDKLAGLIKKIGLIVLGIMMTMFIGFLSIQGPIGAVADGITNKTIKFALGTFIPIVGGYLADAAETVIGCTILIKNAAGLVVMIGVISICIIPILKMSAIVFLYKITCAVTEPISEKRITNCINDVANSVMLIVGAVALVTLMFIILITVVIAAGNISAMIR